MTALSFQRFAQHGPDALAVVDPTGERWARSRLAALAHRVAGALRALPIEPGRSVAIVSPNCAEFLALYLGGIEAGVRVVPVNWHLARDELAFLFADSEAEIVFAHASLGRARLDAIRADSPGARLHISIGSVPAFTSLDAFVAGFPAVPTGGHERGRVMPYTSATTGRPKAVCLPLDNAEAARAKIIDWHLSLGIAPGDDNVHLCTSMLYHSAPLEGAFIALEMGHAVVLADRPDPRALLALIEQYRVTTTFIVPATLVRLAKLQDAERRRFSTASLRFVVHGGAPCPVETKRRMIDWWGPVLWEAYGAAEAQGTIVSPEEWLRRPGTVGKPIPGSQIKILDDEGRELPPGCEGAVYIKPHTGDRFRYKGDPEKTAAAHRGELVTVGDVGRLSPDGYLFLCDRRDDLILSSGMNIYPAEIEHVLVQHPSVADCAVVGMPHELFGQVPKAFVQPAPGAAVGAALVAELLGFLAERLSPMKLPRRIELMPALPRDPSGKLRRRQLRNEGVGEAHLGKERRA